MSLNVTMEKLMWLEFSFGFKLLGAFVAAPVWMHSKVVIQILLSLKGLLAYLTCKWSSVLVNNRMAFKVLNLCQNLSSTLRSLYTCMHSFVHEFAQHAPQFVLLCIIVMLLIYINIGYYFLLWPSAKLTFISWWLICVNRFSLMLAGYRLFRLTDNRPGYLYGI